MSYNTRFTGALKLSRKLTLKEANEWLGFADDMYVFEKVSGISAYLPWVVSDDLEHLVFDGSESARLFSESLSWIVQWLWERQIYSDGVIVWSGEDAGDGGYFEVISSHVTPISWERVATNAQVKPLDSYTLSKLALAQL